MTSPCTQESVNDLELRRVPELEKRVADLEHEVYMLLTRPGYAHIPMWATPEQRDADFR